MDANELALWALIGTALSLIVAMFALLVAIMDWHQIGREEPWNLTKVQDDIWVLERVHRSPVMITCLLNFHGGEVKVLNDAGMPVAHFRRGTKEVLRIRSALGTNLTVFYRPYPLRLRLWDRIRRVPRMDHIREWGNPPDSKKTKQWYTPIY
ncbi:hypothetical protein [Arthrobacter sp. ZBG10]|uniref:hypothetical protein n=1 Tax=Arthrobacter sp. ZBG10 TaxID=1676590 RepID=UPI0012FAEFF5|nr:hypothetical protein [Arthrobacter sp. ZBG10]